MNKLTRWRALSGWEDNVVKYGIIDTFPKALLFKI